MGVWLTQVHQCVQTLLKHTHTVYTTVKCLSFIYLIYDFPVCINLSSLETTTSSFAECVRIFVRASFCGPTFMCHGAVSVCTCVFVCLCPYTHLCACAHLCFCVRVCVSRQAGALPCQSAAPGSYLTSNSQIGKPLRF